ncbi:integrase catalytic domain-containing protein [Trichonephila clavipes]|uniref:Integrase catalytic domain-containing protein n=1 Tax=Trichonephila clavipes TaxID=2585209 RepID=A0A8X6VB69_TRICX|nr:integrase catalytic domain-containing protein [Trichonephila clavipes]
MGDLPKERVFPSYPFNNCGVDFCGPFMVKFKNQLKAPDETLVSHFDDEHIDWHFIPARSPNFCGLWESSVKSFKTHLKRVAGNSNLTLEEFITLLAEIEAALNSRSLSPLSSDFDDFETLSPAHFLISRPVTAIVELQLINVKENRLTRRQMRDPSVKTTSFHSAAHILLSPHHWRRRRLWFCVMGRLSNGCLADRPFCCKRRRMVRADTE